MTLTFFVAEPATFSVLGHDSLALVSCSSLHAVGFDLDKRLTVETVGAIRRLDTVSRKE
jgi:hypothetical protein